jgi:hypothetical protein
MFCCKCGARNPEDAQYCHKCGGILYSEMPVRPDQSAKNNVPLQLNNAQSEEQRRLVEELLSIDQRPHECHACGRTDNLYSWDFGLGKKISSKRAWHRTAASVAISALTIPIIGAGALVLPGKNVHYQVLRLRLVLCGSCWEGEAKYGLHPWWQKAIQLGYTELFDAERLKKLESHP